MMSRTLALGLVSTACVVAAGGGSYLAVRQNNVEVNPAPVVQAAPPSAVQETEAVVAPVEKAAPAAPTPERAERPAPPVERKPEPAPTPAVSAPKPEAPAKASIGKSLHIKGELSGQEDLVIDGTVDGKVSMHGHSVTIGPSGRVQAGIRAKSVVVGGQLRGNVVAEAKFEITATGAMSGDVQAPRVVLADGAKFKGRVDMDGR